jgi:hypothetical protein
MTTAVGGIYDLRPIWLSALAALCAVCLVVFTVHRFGLLTAMILFLVYLVVGNAPLTLDTSKWYFANTIWLMGAATALALLGFYTSRGGEPLLGKRLLD